MTRDSIVTSKHLNLSRRDIYLQPCIKLKPRAVCTYSCGTLFMTMNSAVQQPHLYNRIWDKLWFYLFFGYIQAFFLLQILLFIGYLWSTGPLLLSLAEYMAQQSSVVLPPSSVLQWNCSLLCWAKQINKTSCILSYLSRKGRRDNTSWMSGARLFNKDKNLLKLNPV